MIVKRVKIAYNMNLCGDSKSYHDSYNIVFYLAASLSAPRSLKVVCLMSSKLFALGGQSCQNLNIMLNIIPEVGKIINNHF